MVCHFRAQLSKAALYEQLCRYQFGIHCIMDANLPGVVNVDDIGAIDFVCSYCNACSYQIEKEPAALNVSTYSQIVTGFQKLVLGHRPEGTIFLEAYQIV